MRRLIGPAILGMLPGILGIGGRPAIFGMVGSGGIGAPPTAGGSWPPPGDLTADTSADMDTGDTWETPKLGGGWLISAVEKFSFGKLEPVWKKGWAKSWKMQRRTVTVLLAISAIKITGTHTASDESLRSSKWILNNNNKRLSAEDPSAICGVTKNKLRVKFRHHFCLHVECKLPITRQ